MGKGQAYFYYYNKTLILQLGEIREGKEERRRKKKLEIGGHRKWGDSVFFFFFFLGGFGRKYKCIKLISYYCIVSLFFFNHTRRESEKNAPLELKPRLFARQRVWGGGGGRGAVNYIVEKNFFYNNGIEL